MQYAVRVYATRPMNKEFYQVQSTALPLTDLIPKRSASLCHWPASQWAISGAAAVASAALSAAAEALLHWADQRWRSAGRPPRP